MQEVWKDIEGYEGRYQVSNFGHVKSLRYRGRNEARLLVPKCNNSGRLWVELFVNGKKKCMLIHRLVAMAFIPNPNGCLQINHIDENPKNNVVWNLEWCTAKENISKYLKNHPDALSERCKSSINARWNKRNNHSGKSIIIPYKHKKPILQMTTDGEIVTRWDNISTVCRENGWNCTSLLECCRGKRKTAYGYIWRYAN